MKLTPYIEYDLDREIDSRFSLDVVYNGEIYIINYDVDSPHVIDDGIGGYEYWGFKGNDVRLVVEYDGLIVHSVWTYEDDENPLNDVELIKRILVDRYGELTEYADENLDVEDFRDYDDEPRYYDED